MLSMLPKETYTLEEFQKTLGELAEKIPERLSLIHISEPTRH